jgi:hypothetical protein
MSGGIARVDITNSPDLARLAEEVQASKQPRYLAKGGEVLVMVTPVAPKRTHTLASATAGEEESTIERKRAALFARPSPAELARRQALIEQILEERKTRVITPLTSADLVHQVREEEYRSYDERR